MVANGMKRCPACEHRKRVGAFCTLDGYPSTRGRYCVDCHIANEKATEKAILEGEREKVSILRLIYGQWWLHYAPPGEFEYTLFRERDHCLYCGGWLPPLYVPASVAPRPSHGRAQLDHMDPLSRGGEDSIRNVVFICDECNAKKRNHLFLDWLGMLRSDHAAIARAVYLAKHDHPPEFFQVGEAQPRFPRGTALVVFQFSDAELGAMYPAPIVTGPPRAYLARLTPRDDL